ncbi:hypothetical protein Bpfe_027769 [Biomphalaria pfeifferi]|uniref:Ig-like domain-containing protein n=1 Tax=Biomphalaria pfeifferi TaxID=112525 RepID=A0AAD8AXF9_BIOPF|nr:hypothetical protein Bpfe_027769 [Biomphalaria pfeifferi]
MERTLIQIFLALVFSFQVCCSEVNEEKCPKYSVPDSTRPLCIQCRLCIPSKGVSIHQSCKEAYPLHINSQGLAWCTSVNFPQPSCPKWEVANGKVNCSNKFSIRSKCSVMCDAGFSVVKKTLVRCTDDLHWDINENSRPWCNRTDPPGQPTISSSIIHTQVRAGSDVTLICKNTTVPVGNVAYFWKFNNKDLLNDKHSNTYTIMAAKKEDEGYYRCIIQDQIGISSISLNYCLEVEVVVDFVTSLVVESPQTEFKGLSVESPQPEFKGLSSESPQAELTGLSIGSLKAELKGLTIESSQSEFKGLSIAGIIASIVTAVFILGFTLKYKNHIKVWVLSFKPKKKTNGNDKTSGQSVPLAQDDVESNRQEDSVSSNPLEEETFEKTPLASECHQSSDVVVPEESYTAVDRSQTSKVPCENDVPSKNCVLCKHYLRQVSNNDQRALAQLIGKKSVVDHIIKFLDQLPDVNRNHPTFRDLGIFLGMNEDSICNLEFVCQQYKTSPTYELLRTMKSEGKGFSSFKEFLFQHKCVHLINNIQTAMEQDKL